MSDENKKTLEVYKKTANLYLSNSKEHDRIDPVKADKKRKKLEELIKINFSLLPQKAKIFEFGCGDGSNAKFIESLGFEVTASDMADDFIEAARKKRNQYY